MRCNACTREAGTRRWCSPRCERQRHLWHRCQCCGELVPGYVRRRWCGDVCRLRGYWQVNGKPSRAFLTLSFEAWSALMEAADDMGDGVSMAGALEALMRDVG